MVETTKSIKIFSLLIIYYLSSLILSAAPIVCDNYDLKKPPRFGRRSHLIAGLGSTQPCLEGSMRRMSLSRSSNDIEITPLLNYIIRRQDLYGSDVWYIIQFYQYLYLKYILIEKIGIHINISINQIYYTKIIYFFQLIYSNFEMNYFSPKKWYKIKIEIMCNLL